MYNDMELVEASARLSAAALGYLTLKEVLKAIHMKDFNTCIHNHFFVSSFPFLISPFLLLV